LVSGGRYWVRVDDAERPVCCAGCQAVATFIRGAGLGRFYQFREAPAGKSVDAADARRWMVYDRPAILAQSTRELRPGLREVACRIDGITCGACVWLIEQGLARRPGITDVAVNPVTRHAYLRYEPQAIALSEVLAAVAKLGFEPRPRAVVRGADRAEAASRSELKRLAVAGLGFAQVMTLSAALYLGAFKSMEVAYSHFFVLVSMIVATPVVLFAGAPIFRAAWSDLRHGRLGMDVPISLAIVAAMSASLFNSFRGAGEVYFDSATMFVFFLTLGRFLEARARHRAGSQLDALADLVPASAIRRVGDELQTVGTVELAPGDRVIVEPGAAVPADGELIDEYSAVDESLLSGESLARRKRRGDAVLGGSLNVGARPLELRITGALNDSYIARIGALLERAMADRPVFVQTADRWARWFVVGVLAVASSVGLLWWQMAPERAFDVVLAVLVVTCPCALSLATPTALTVALGALAQQGLLLKSARVVERIVEVTRWMFDKTGTLTTGRVSVQDVETLGGLDAPECASIAAALEAGIDHPIARAFARSEQHGIAADVQLTAGAGVTGVVAGEVYRLGTRAFALGELEDEASNVSRVYLAGESGLLARFTLSDNLRPSARPALAALQASGLGVAIVSGDQAGAVRHAARSLGLDEWHAAQQPEGKLALVRDWQSRGEVVAAVGDGVNDAPVLAAADVSIAMMEGSRLAQAGADIVFTGDDLGTLAALPAWARATRTTIVQNLSWAVCYNGLALPAAAAGWVTPWLAALGMSLSSLLVVANALRLRSRLSPSRTIAALPAAESLTLNEELS
jgi:Cu2+-exporting ATPase